MRMIPLLALAAIACGAPTEKLTDSGAADTPQGELDLDDDEPGPNSNAPVLEWATLEMHSGRCFLEAGYDDAQGPADVRRGTVVAVDPSTGEELWRDDLFVCVDFACVGSFADYAAYLSAPCSASDRFEYHAFVYDRSDLESNIVVLDQ